jgi:cyclopropane-fatty-acyl-phospholipid synthase
VKTTTCDGTAEQECKAVTKSTEKTSDRNIEKTLSLLNDTLGPAPLQNVAVRLWDGTIWKPKHLGEQPRCTLVLQHPGALRKMFLPPTDRNLGEAYIFNDFDVEGDIEDFVLLMVHLFEQHWGLMERLRFGQRLLGLPNTGQPRSAALPMKPRGRVHSKERDRRSTNYHYDRSNDFYALWLDQRMIYSCAYFATPDDDLDTAQNAKLDYICRKLRLKPGERLLDIGCGWGGLVMHAAQHYGVQADGITLSARQVEFASERIKKAGLEERCRVDLRDYREASKPQAYDKLVSVGMAEHLGEALLPTYFKSAWGLLRPGGVFLHHYIGFHSSMPVLGLGFIHSYVFPDCELIPIGTTLGAAEAAGFGVRDVENLKEHYAYTARHWIRRLETHAVEAKKVAGETTYRIWRLYLAMGAYGFSVGPDQLYQVLLVKPDGGRSRLPLRRDDWYAASHASGR